MYLYLLENPVAGYNLYIHFTSHLEVEKKFGTMIGFN